MLRSALYYPHTDLENDDLLKTALLLWDKVELIVPHREYRHEFPSREVAEAVELLCVDRVPTEEEKRETHEALKRRFDRANLPLPFYARSSGGYEIWPDKLLMETWEMLHEHSLVEYPAGNGDYNASNSAGLLIMSVLADSLAGETRARITDESSAYAALAAMLSESKGSNDGASGGAYGRLAQVPLPMLDLAQVSLDDAVSFRERERDDPGLTDLRHRYVGFLENYVTQLRLVTKTSDIEEILRVFQSDAEGDLRELERQLAGTKRRLISAKSVFAIVSGLGMAAIGHFMGASLAIEGTLTAAGTPLAIWDLIGNVGEYGESRSEVLTRHPLAYIHQLASYL